MSTEKAIERSTTNTLPAHPERAEGSSALDQSRSQWTYSPYADIFESANEYTIVLDMAGVSPENIEVTCESRTLIVHGRVHEPVNGRRAVRTEYGVGDYFRRFELSDTIDLERITATCAHGVVTVHLPKVEAARPIRIPVSNA